MENKKTLIGAGIAALALLMVILLPVASESGEAMGFSVSVGFKLFDLFSVNAFLALIYIIFPVLCIVANVMDKMRAMASYLMLIPFIWSIFYHPGAGVWVYGVLAIAEIFWTRKSLAE